MPQILIVDDDPQLLDMVELVLSREGYHVQRAFNAYQAMELVRRDPPDLVIVDVMLPDMDGFTLCKTLRNTDETATLPLLVLTAAQTSSSVVDALTNGADDFIRKPFQPRELIARVRAHLRRANKGIDPAQPVIRILPSQFRVFVGDREVTLTRVEFDLLRYLCQRPHELHSTEELLSNVWQYPDGVGDSALVRNHIHNLRHKIEVDPERPTILQSRHGRGYVIKAQTLVEGESLTAYARRATMDSFRQ
ncbi:MAG: response regulator transcription factor [Anaerolineae bacterium]